MSEGVATIQLSTERVGWLTRSWVLPVVAKPVNRTRRSSAVPSPFASNLLFAFTADRLWFGIGRRTLKARMIRTRPAVAVVVPGQKASVAMRGQATLLDGLPSPSELARAPFALPAYAGRNALEMAAFARDTLDTVARQVLLVLSWLGLLLLPGLALLLWLLCNAKLIYFADQSQGGRRHQAAAAHQSRDGAWAQVTFRIAAQPVVICVGGPTRA